MIDELTNLGFTYVDSKWAVEQCAENSSLEHIVNLLLSRLECEESIPTTTTTIANTATSLFDFRPMKMMLIVRMDLNMSAGKVAAQSVHAALGCYRAAISRDASLVRNWELQGEPVIALQCENDDEIERLLQLALATNVTTYAVLDAGRTEVASGSRTVMAIGPNFNDVIDNITKNLKLYR